MNDEQRLFFVDTNFLVYAYDQTTGQKHRQGALLEDLWNLARACLSIQVLHEFCVVITQKAPYPIQPEVAAAIVCDLAF